MLKKHKVLDILSNRFENDLIRYFSQFPSKTEVKYFVCDMNSHFREVAKTCFPKAAVVADRYHVIRQIYWAKDSVLPYLKIVSERFTPTRPNYLCFVSSPTIAIEPLFTARKEKGASLRRSLLSFGGRGGT